MWCEARFRRFSDNLKLNPTRLERIRSAVRHFENFCAADDELSPAMGDRRPFLQGSVATNTAVRPIDRDEHDVDLVYPFRHRAFQNDPDPMDVISWFRKRLNTSEFYRERIVPKNRCMRIDYAGDFHLDIIPAAYDIPQHQPYAVPARDVSAWVTTDPVGFTDWVHLIDEEAGDLDSDHCGRFVRSVCVMKRWRDRRFGDASAPSSILLTTLLGKHDPSRTYAGHCHPRFFPEHPYIAAYLYDMLRLTDSCIDESSAAAFQHPTLPEDLARGWQHEHLGLFRTRLQACIAHLGAGIAAQTEADALSSFREAFGEFPGA